MQARSPGDSLRLLDLLKKLATSDTSRAEVGGGAGCGPALVGCAFSAGGWLAALAPGGAYGAAPHCLTTSDQSMCRGAPPLPLPQEPGSGHLMADRLLDMVWQLTMPADAPPELLEADAMAQVLRQYGGQVRGAAGGRGQRGRRRGGQGFSGPRVGRAEALTPMLLPTAVVVAVKTHTHAPPPPHHLQGHHEYCETYVKRCVEQLRVGQGVFTALRVLRSLLQLNGEDGKTDQEVRASWLWGGV